LSETELIYQIAMVTSITTATTTATTYVIVSKITSGIQKEICNKIEKLAIRLGVVEESHAKE